MSVSSMKRLTVFANRTDQDKILRRLMGLRCVEIHAMDLSDSELALKRAESEENLALAEKALADIRAVLPVLTKYSTRKNGLGRISHSFDPDRFAKDGSCERARDTVLKALAAQERMREMAAERARLQELCQSYAPWVDYDAPLNETQTRFTRTQLGSCPTGTKEELLEQELLSVNACVETVGADKSGVYVAVTYHREDEQAVNAVLASLGFLKAELADASLSAEQAIAQYEQKIDQLEAETVGQEELLRDLAENLELVEILHDVTDTERTVALLYRQMAETGSCTLLEGWIPSFAEDAVAETLKKFECAYEVEEPKEDDDPPVLLRNNKFAQNFEWVVGMYSYPQYGRFDPTFIMSIFYFLIFGLMFADVGYGLVLTLGSLAWIKLLNPKPSMQRMLYMFSYCGISAVVMGVVFGGWFGDLPTAIMQNVLHMPIDTEVGHFFGSGLWFNPLDNPMGFLIFAIGLGFLHLIAGMAVKFFILCRDKKVFEAFSTVFPYWVLFAGILLMLKFKKPGLIVAGVGVALILLLNGYGIKNPIKRLIKGLGGLYGVVSYASDLLSYSRILALALVAAVIAKVVNMITLAGGSKNIGGIILMVVVLVIGHILNLALNVLGAFVHSSRLQYLEFFGKFYEDGGKPFEPVLPTEQYSESTENEIQNESHI